MQATQPSPYTPGSLAEALPGRDAQMRGILERLAYLSYKHSLVGRIRAFVGPRGIGKTSLLRRAQQEAENLGFATVWITAGDEMALAAAIADELERLSHGWAASARTALRAAVKTVSISVAGITVGAGDTGSGGSPPVGTGRALQDAVKSAIKGATEGGSRGLVIFVDEMQAGDAAGLKALAYAWQHLQAEAQDLPSLVVGAGLSHTPDVVSKAVSFGERFEYLPLSNLDADAARHALVIPARAVGVDWEPDAVQAVLAETQGYPYFIQEFGDKMWHAAGLPGPGHTLRRRHFNAAYAEFKQSRDSMFRSRWVQTTPMEAKMLTAMAVLGDVDVPRRDIAAQLGVDSRAISMARRSLMDKGLIEPSTHGKLRFTAPGFGGFIREYTDLA